MTMPSVLVVDDHLLVRTITVRIVKSLGYAVVSSASAGEALAQAAGKPVDILLTDYRLPGGITGVELAAQLEQTGQRIAVIVMSAASVSYLPVLPPHYRFLEKPFTVEQLAATLAEVLATVRRSITPS